MKNTEVLIILGMHRSGTSCLAKCLMGMGVNFTLPKIMDGYWEKHVEYYHVNQLNDRIIKNWKNPVLKRNKFISILLKQKVKLFIKNNLYQDDLIGLKDPRLCITFDYWFKNSSTIKILGIFRRPEEVGKSLEIRDEYGKTSFENGVNLWRIYNEQLLKVHDKHPFPILDFNLSKIEFGKSLERACFGLGIKYSDRIFSEIFRDKERHHYSENISKKCKNVYSELQKRKIPIF